MKPPVVNMPLTAFTKKPRKQFGLMNKEITFRSNGVLTLGVEMELQLIDPLTKDLSPRAKELLKEASYIERVKPEYYLSTVEINTGICPDVQAVEQDLRHTMAALNPVAEKLGIQFATTGAHPFARYADCLISPTVRYKEMTERNQWISRRMTVYGLHVHIGMADGDECIRFNNFFMHFLPHMLALSGSSPFWQGMDTGLSSCRPTTYEALPIAGLPYTVKNWQEFGELYSMLRRCDSIKSLRDLWWDLRPSPAYGTLEIRVCDGTATLYETLALVAFIHCLAHWFQENGALWEESLAHDSHWLSRENKWRAIRYGLDAELVIHNDGQTTSLRRDIEQWVARLIPYARKLGYQEYMSDVLSILQHGNSSVRQRSIFEQTRSLQEVVKANVEEYYAQRPFWNEQPPALFPHGIVSEAVQPLTAV